jgi:hypothetical protein
MSNISPNSQTESLEKNEKNEKNENVFPVPSIENKEESDEEKLDENQENQENDDENETYFSKNSIINISRKAGVKCISQCGIDKTRTILHNKIKEMSEKLVFFYTSRNGKTITKKMVLDFLESEQIHITQLTNIA